MEVLSLIGILLAFVAILGGNILEGGTIGSLLNAPAALIVVGGTLAASLLQSRLPVLKRTLQISHWILLPPRVELTDGIEKVTRWCLVARKYGLLVLVPMSY